jgi:hypothetical protein
MVEIGSAVGVPRAVVTGMRMQIDGEIVVKVNGSSQDRSRLRHKATRRCRLRRGNHRSLLYECNHRRQHHCGDDASQVWI